MEEELETNKSFVPRSLDDQWSNTECIKIAFEDRFPNAVTDKTVQKNIITRFLNFYLGARIQKGIDVQDLVYSTISIMPLHEVTEEFIFADFHYDKDGTLFFLSPEEKLKAEIKEVVAKTAHAKEPDVEKSEKEPVQTVKKANNQTQSEEAENVHSPPVVNDEKKDIVEDTEGAKASSSNTQKEVVMEPEDTSIKPKLESKESFVLKFPENIRWFGNKSKRSEEDTNLRQYGPLENAAFGASCNKLLEAWDTSEKARIVLKYFFGVVALTLMRATTKTYKHLVNTFSSNKFLKNLPNCIHQYIQYSIPHKKCIKSSYRTFSRRDGNLRVMFAKIIINSFHIDTRRREVAFGSLEDTETNFSKMNIFKVTILAHTANYGMGILNMVQTIHGQSDNEQFHHVVAATFCEETDESWRRLKKFIEKYMVTTTKESTHYWARVVDGDYFRSLCCSTNFPLAVILAIFIEKMTKSPGIWQSTWVERGDSLETYKDLGTKMYEKYAAVKPKLQFQFIRLGQSESNEETLQLNEESEDLIKTVKSQNEYIDTRLQEMLDDLLGRSSKTLPESQKLETNDSKPGTSQQNQMEMDKKQNTTQNTTKVNKTQTQRTKNDLFEDYDPDSMGSLDVSVDPGQSWQFDIENAVNNFDYEAFMDNCFDERNYYDFD